MKEPNRPTVKYPYSAREPLCCARRLQSPTLAFSDGPEAHRHRGGAYSNILMLSNLDVTFPLVVYCCRFKMFRSGLGIGAKSRKYCIGAGPAACTVASDETGLEFNKNFWEGIN